MPLTDEQKTAVQTFAAAMQGADVSDVAAEMKTAANAVYSRVFGIGHGAGKREAEDAAKAQATALEAAQAERDQAVADLEALKGKAPEADAIRADFEQKLTEAKQRAEAAEARAKEVEEGAALKAAEADVLAGLTAAGVHPDWAKSVELPKARSRMKAVRGEDGAVSVRYYDADGATPLQDAGQGLPARLASDLRAAVPDQFIVSAADGGSGLSGDAAGASGGYDPVKAGQEAAAAQKGAPAELAFT